MVQCPPYDLSCNANLSIWVGSLAALYSTKLQECRLLSTGSYRKKDVASSKQLVSLYTKPDEGGTGVGTGQCWNNGSGALPCAGPAAGQSAEPGPSLRRQRQALVDAYASILTQRRFGQIRLNLDFDFFSLSCGWSCNRACRQEVLCLHCAEGTQRAGVGARVRAHARATQPCVWAIGRVGGWHWARVRAPGLQSRPVALREAKTPDSVRAVRMSTSCPPLAHAERVRSRRR